MFLLRFLQQIRIFFSQNGVFNMKRIKPLILTAILSVSVATATAGGIPVFDGVANGRDTIHQAQEIVQMAKEVKHWVDTIKHYKNELSELKDTKQALNGLKGLVSYDKDVADLINGFDDLMKGNPDQILNRAEKYFDELAKQCEKMNADKKKTCQQATLGEIMQEDFAERLNKRFEKELKNIEDLQQKAANAKDAKSIAEVQAAIGLQQNKIQLLALQADNFNRLQQARKEIAEKQRHDEYMAKIKARKEERKKCGWFGCDSPYSTQKQNSTTDADYNKVLGL